MGSSLENRSYALTSPTVWWGKKTQISTYHLVRLFTELVKRQHLHCVGQPYPYKI